MSKKTAIITFRTEEWVKNEIQKYAEANKWSPAQTVEEIIKLFIANPHPNKITVKTTDLIEMVEALKENECGGAEISIELHQNSEETILFKELEIGGLITGGYGYISLDKTAPEMTEEEVLEIE